jgi:hypothetical protein
MLREFSILIGLAMTPALTAPQPRDRVSISCGQGVVVRVAADGTLQADAPAEAAPLNAFESGAVAAMKTTPSVGTGVQPPVVIGQKTLTPPIVPAGQVRLTLRNLPADAAGGNGQTMLEIENGYDGALRYRAALRRGGRSTPTDVCIVMPHRLGFEYWPYPVEEVDISDVRVVPWHEGDGITCE